MEKVANSGAIWQFVFGHGRRETTFSGYLSSHNYFSFGHRGCQLVSTVVEETRHVVDGERKEHAHGGNRSGNCGAQPPQLALVADGRVGHTCLVEEVATECKERLKYRNTSTDNHH